MRKSGFTHLVFGLALAAVLVTGGKLPAAATTPDPVDAAIPMPEPANVPPPTPADVGAVPAATPAVPAATPAGPASETKDNAQTAPAPAAETGEEQKEPPKPVIATNLSPADHAVAEKIHDILANRDRLFGGKKERTAVEAFYSGRGFAPLWIDNGAGNDRSKAAIAHLAAADTDGLDPSDYPTPDFKAAATPDGLAESELRLTASVLTYARHAQAGRIHFSRVSADIFYTPVAPEIADVLTAMAETNNVDEALSSYNPPQPGYKALKAKLAEIRGGVDSGPVRIVPGPMLKVGMQDERVPKLRERLGVPAEADNTTYDKALAEAVKKYQREQDLSPTGNLTNATVEALNGTHRGRTTDIIIANMERWRWMPRDLGKAYVMVNIPAYTLRVMRDRQQLWSTRIVVGQPAKPTPLISAAMQYITINPTWNVPPSIIQNEYLPALQQDPGALDRIGLKVEHNRDGTIHIYQPPGDANALGRIRFNFPNKFLVYQHDTPDKYLFARDKRAYSHGCMRVQDPVKYAEVLLSIALPKEGYTQERIHRMFGSAEDNINFPQSIPVHITYQTAYVDDAGKLVILDDVYGRDARMIAILRGDERRVAEIPVERRDTTMTRPVRDPYQGMFGQQNTAGGFNLFGFFR